MGRDSTIVSTQWDRELEPNTHVNFTFHRFKVTRYCFYWFFSFYFAICFQPAFVVVVVAVICSPPSFDFCFCFDILRLRFSMLTKWTFDLIMILISQCKQLATYLINRSNSQTKARRRKSEKKQSLTASWQNCQSDFRACLDRLEVSKSINAQALRRVHSCSWSMIIDELNNCTVQFMVCNLNYN